MTISKSAHALVCAGALAIAAAGCSKHNEPEETAPPETAATQGGEAQGTQSATDRMNESSRGGYSAAKATEEKGRETMPSGTATQPAPTEMTFTDARIMRITDIVNTGEIQQAQVAQQKSVNPQIKQFAAQMIRDHRKAREAGAKLANSEGITPQDSPMATKVSDEGTDMLESLQGTMPGLGFDRLYIQTQAKQHREVLQMLDTELIPNAQNERLQNALLKTRAMVEHHLREAQNIDMTM